MELGNLEETKEAMQAAKEEEARLEQGEEVGMIMQRGEVYYRDLLYAHACCLSRCCSGDSVTLL